jgi:hypothetical protein
MTRCLLVPHADEHCYQSSRFTSRSLTLLENGTLKAKSFYTLSREEQ